MLILFSATEAPDESPMLAFFAWVIRARSHHEHVSLNTIATSSARAACMVVVRDQLDTAQGAEALGDIQKRNFGLFSLLHLSGAVPHLMFLRRMASVFTTLTSSFTTVRFQLVSSHSEKH